MSRKKKWCYSIITVVLWLVVWQMTAYFIDNQIFLPSPQETVESLKRLFVSAEFYQSIGFSLGNIVKGFLLGVFVGMILAIGAAWSDFFETFVSLPLRIIKATPVASFTVLALFWIDSSELSVLISFFMVLPVVYSNVLAGIRETDTELKEMVGVFKVRLFDQIRFLYIPSVLPYLCSAVSVAIGLAWKSGVAAEVIGIVKDSIGNHLYQAKIYMEMPELFAWTAVTVLISVASEKLILWLVRLLERAVYGNAEETVGNEPITVMQDNDTEENNLPCPEEKKREIRVHKVSKSYGDKKILENVSLSFSPKHPVALMGTSGIGKTTLLRMILGTEHPDEGEIERAEGVKAYAVVFQENRLFERVSVEKNLQCVCRTDTQKAEIPHLLKRLGLYACRKQKVACLSGGMKRRVAIGRALLRGGQVLLLDEPFQGLDEGTKQAVIGLVKEKMCEKSVLLITHDEKEAAGLGCEILQL
ncbi:MAG: ATP-binding cassette domain-containing protein [Lachnospiraceae bacterium]|nr:ATP-binding cassette domain-containing protein [Lachnospiraceae bacterium]